MCNLSILQGERGECEWVKFYEDAYVRLTSASANLRNKQVDTERAILVLEVGLDWLDLEVGCQDLPDETGVMKKSPHLPTKDLRGISYTTNDTQATCICDSSC